MAITRARHRMPGEVRRRLGVGGPMAASVLLASCGIMAPARPPVTAEAVSSPVEGSLTSTVLGWEESHWHGLGESGAEFSESAGLLTQWTRVIGAAGPARLSERTVGVAFLSGAGKSWAGACVEIETNWMRIEESLVVPHHVECLAEGVRFTLPVSWDARRDVAGVREVVRFSMSQEQCRLWILSSSPRARVGGQEVSIPSYVREIVRTMTMPEHELDNAGPEAR
jgi:hypothetical protein